MKVECGVTKELNILTDILYSSEWSNCKAGEMSFVYGPDGNFYVCPASYCAGKQHMIGNPANGMHGLKNARLYRRDFHPLCQLCDTKQCRICIYLNQTATAEVNVSPSYQCRKSHIERAVSYELQKYLNIPVENRLKSLNYLDPIVLAKSMQKKSIGYYKAKQ